MKTHRLKILGIALTIAASALFGWVLYEPATLVSVLQLSRVASEAAVVTAALAVAGLSFAGGGVLLFASREVSEG